MSLHFEFNETLDIARKRNVHDALMEDIGLCDWTAELVPGTEKVKAKIIVREAAVLCGRAWVDDCFQALDPQSQIIWAFAEGDPMPADSLVCQIKASARAMLSAERPALNFLQLLSGTATVTRRYVKAIEGASPNPRGCVVLDTRKTLPGLRQAQKYAVRIGGGENQRLALWDGILIKENHIAAAGGIPQVLAQAKALESKVGIQIEVETLNQLRQALECGAQSILLDNFNVSQMREAVRMNQGQALLEVSGNVQFEQLQTIAATGVDRISLGCLTKNVTAIDYSMRVTERLA
ncbi:MAG: carboxylating nicotinate-nucleotide diphosphorylase [Burkholderiales bacterium]